jgi:hypothetical protein
VRLCFVSIVVALVALALALAASAKDFKPGDVRVCSGSNCLVLRCASALNGLSAFYYSAKPLGRATAPARDARYVELRFRNGYVTGIAAGKRYDRFLSYGVNLGHFRARNWYSIPWKVARAIARLAAELRPKPLPGDVLDRSH